jgi:hypothetical protein
MLNFTLDLSDKLKYAVCVAGNVKGGPIKVLELDDALRWHVWKAGVRELEYSLDGRLGRATVTVARLDSGGAVSVLGTEGKKGSPGTL